MKKDKQTDRQNHLHMINVINEHERKKKTRQNELDLRQPGEKRNKKSTRQTKEKMQGSQKKKQQQKKNRCYEQNNMSQASFGIAGRQINNVLKNSS